MVIPEDIMQLIREKTSPHGFLGITEKVSVRKFASQEEYEAHKKEEGSDERTA